jgi:hypothetical protein
LGADPSGEAQRDARRATLNGLRAFANSAQWVYFVQRGRLRLNAPYSTGLVTYTNATRTVTLIPDPVLGGEFPGWAQYGNIQINSVVYQVQANPDPLTLILSATSNPQQDISQPASFMAFQDTYPLPPDCLQIDRLILVNFAWALNYDTPASWLERQRIWRGPAAPRSYTIRGDSQFYGVMAVSFFPTPDAAYDVDFIYRRVPRALFIDDYTTGTASAVTGSTTVTGSGTSWTSRMLGSCIRLSGDAITPPTGIVGPNPAQVEGVITQVNGPTNVTIDMPSPVTLGGVEFIVSDPVDCEPSAMLTALYRSCEYQMALSRNRKDAPQVLASYKDALIQAREADSRNTALEMAGAAPRWYMRLAWMPRGPDVP